MKNTIPYIRPSLFDENRVIAGFSMYDGTSATDMGINTITNQDSTQSNRHRFLKQLGIKKSNLAYAQQVHGNDVLVVQHPGLQGKADGLVTNRKNMALGIMVADCAAIVLSDAETGIIGVFHAGWRGAATGVLPNGIEKMKELGAGRIKAWISPCISTHSFEVGDEVAYVFPSAFVLTEGYFKPRVDLSGFLQHQLRFAGIEKKDIHCDERCTVSDIRFHSYRRDGKQSGRMMAVAALRS